MTAHGDQVRCHCGAGPSPAAHPVTQRLGDADLALKQIYLRVTQPTANSEEASILVRLDADSDIRQALDKALAEEEAPRKVAAAKELSRWFVEADLGTERDAKWRTSERLQQLVSLALSDSVEFVRMAAAQALGNLKSEFVQKSLVVALSDNAVEVRLAAGQALVRVQAHDEYRHVAEAMVQIAEANLTQDLRRRAGKVLSEIPTGLDAFHRPVQAALNSAEWQRALDLINAALEISPDDVNLFWWRGYALRNLGELGQAADSYARAAELEKQTPVIPQALAQTFLELGDFQRALDAVRRGIEIDPGDAESQSILAWCSYKVGEIDAAVKAARMAVDLDPVHGDAIWIILLAHIRQSDLGEARSAFQHALRVRQLLSPGLDTSFITSFLKELEDISTEDVEISRLLGDIKDALVSDASALAPATV